MFSGVRNAAAGLGAATLALAAGFSLPAQAAFVFTMVQIGSTIVINGTGSINTTDLALTTQFNQAGAAVYPSIGQLVVSSDEFLVKTFSPISGPINFGPGGSYGGFGMGFAAIGGDEVGILASTFGVLQPVIIVPSTYVSGQSLSDTMTVPNDTFAGLGVTPGTYVWTWGTGANADSFTLQIGPVTTTPEPASLTLLAMGLAGLGMVLRLRQRDPVRPEPAATMPARVETTP